MIQLFIENLLPSKNFVICHFAVTANLSQDANKKLT